MPSKTFRVLRGPQSMILLSFITLLFSCSKSTPGNNTVASLTGFSFSQSANPIPVSSTASINGTSITVFLPPGTNVNALIPDFSLSDSGIVRVDGMTQQTGVTPVNFSAPVIYTVTSPNGTVQTYTVTLITDISAIDANVAAFMSQYNVPALSIAITQNEKLVYAKAYGHSDIEDNQVATTNNLYRLSSLSKQITSVAIMKLMDQGKINLNDKVFGNGAILGTTFGTLPYGPGITDITVAELLNHTEGGWPDNNTDPNSIDQSLSIQQVINYGLDNVPLITSPGTPNSYYYSHFGYCILGRVIEKITGLPYTQAVQSLVLQPSGITDMQIAGNTLADRAPNEVKYYDANQWAYTFNISRMDAAQAWLASATDMARFLVHVDGLSSQTILSPNAIQLMTTGSVANPKYGLGWEINQYNWFHHGNLPGTGTTQARTTQSGNFNYVILTNTSSSDPNYSGNMDNIFWTALPVITSWPSYDLFNAVSPK
jgi:D-alanyl-D-alanine carboxypeptidase